MSDQEGSESTSPDQTLIQIGDFNAWYGDFQALHGLELAVPKHKVTAFIGPSGCGKEHAASLDQPNERHRARRSSQGHTQDSWYLPTPKAKVTRTSWIRHWMWCNCGERLGSFFQKPNPFPKSIYDNRRVWPASAHENDQVRTGRIGRMGAAQGSGLGRGQRPTQCPPLWDFQVGSNSGFASHAPSQSVPRSC